MCFARAKTFELWLWQAEWTNAINGVHFILCHPHWILRWWKIIFLFIVFSAFLFPSFFSVVECSFSSFPYISWNVCFLHYTRIDSRKMFSFRFFLFFFFLLTAADAYVGVPIISLAFVLIWNACNFLCVANAQSNLLNRCVFQVLVNMEISWQHNFHILKVQCNRSTHLSVHSSFHIQRFSSSSSSCVSVRAHSHRMKMRKPFGIGSSQFVCVFSFFSFLKRLLYMLMLLG